MGDNWLIFLMVTCEPWEMIGESFFMVICEPWEIIGESFFNGDVSHGR